MSHGGSKGGIVKSFLTWDDLMRDLLILLAIGGVVYIGNTITPITLETVLSGEVFKNLWNFLLGKGPGQATITYASLALKSFLVVSGVFLLGAIYVLKRRYDHIHHIDHEQYEPIHPEEVGEKEMTIQWEVIQNHLASENPAEWKLAVLEADEMLDEVLARSGYQGETLGEKLKAINPQELKSYQDAWNAHKVRNQIAHEGTTMDFSHKVARDAIHQYENVFKELGFL